MTQRSRAFDDLANLVANAAGAAKGVGDELRAVGRARAEKAIAELDLVTREELDVMRARLDKQAAEIADLRAVVAGLSTFKTAMEAAATQSKSVPKSASKSSKTSSKKSAAKTKSTGKTGKAAPKS